MLKFLTTALDKGALRMASCFQADGAPQPHHPVEAERLLNDPELFFGIQGVTPDLEFTNWNEFHFTSAVSTRWAENNRVSGRFFRAGAGWKSRPSVILLHGWSAEMQYHWQFPFLARRLVRAGVNAAMFELPYHGRRRPREPGAIQNFISHDLLHMIDATRQSLSDARALLAWLSAQGSPSVGVWGVSLGAWLGGLLICSRAQACPSFAVLLTPIASVEQAIQELAFCKSIRSSLEKASSVRLEPLNLASHVPKVPPENILLVESKYDLFAPAATVENLWRAWGQPEIWRLPHGHISILLSPFILQRIVNWIQRKGL